MSATLHHLKNLEWLRSIEGTFHGWFPSKFVFNPRLSPIKSRLPLMVVFHQSRILMNIIFQANVSVDLHFESSACEPNPRLVRVVVVVVLFVVAVILVFTVCK